VSLGEPQARAYPALEIMMALVGRKGAAALQELEGNWFPLVPLGLLLVANLVAAARIFDTFWSNASRLSFAVQGLVIGYFLVVAVRRGDWRLVAAAVAVAAYFVFAHFLFVFQSGTAVNLNAIAVYLPLLAFVPFYEADVPIGQILRVWVIATAVYLLVYVLANGRLASGAEMSSALLENHNQSGKRVFLAAAHASFVAFYGLKVRQLHPALRVALIALAVCALWMSGSRTFLLVFGMVFLIGAAGGMTRLVRIALFSLVMAVAATLLAGLLWPSWNPFDYMIWDDSAYYRGHEYAAAMRAIVRHPLLGAGISGVFGDLQHYFGTARYEPLFGSDLGVLGPLIDFGVLGLAAFVGALYFALVPEAPSHRLDVHALKLTCITCAVNGMISPILLFDPGASFLMMLIAIWLRRDRARTYLGDYAERIRRHLASGVTAAGGPPVDGGAKSTG
jgi:hypothetical protein